MGDRAGPIAEVGAGLVLIELLPEPQSGLLGDVPYRVEMRRQRQDKRRDMRVQSAVVLPRQQEKHPRLRVAA
jgi:hypothetical protein